MAADWGTRKLKKVNKETLPSERKSQNTQGSYSFKDVVVTEPVTSELFSSFCSLTGLFSGFYLKPAKDVCFHPFVGTLNHVDFSFLVNMR